MEYFLRLFKSYRRSYGGSWVKTKERGWLTGAEYDESRTLSGPIIIKTEWY